jgi:hypothetical protein
MLDATVKRISMSLGCCFLAATLSAWAASPEMILQIEADWLRQQSLSGQSIERSIEDVIVRGRALAQDLQDITDECVPCVKVLDDVERRLAQEKKKQAKQVMPHEMPEAKGLKLVAVDHCGGGANLDTHRIQGKDWSYSKAELSADMTTLSWHETEVRYRFQGLDPQAAYKLRVIYLSNAKRVQALWVDGHKLHDVTADNYRPVEKWETIPAQALSDGRIDLRFRHRVGANAIVSAIELWSDKMQTDIQPKGMLKSIGKLSSQAVPPSPAMLSLYYEARWAVRRLAFQNPLLHENRGILFVRRYHPTRNHQCSRRRSRYNEMGGDICVLKGVFADETPEIVSLTQERFPEGVFARPDISFDGQRIVFGFAAADITEPRRDIANDYLSRTYFESLGNGSFFQVWEMGLNPDGPAPRQITRATGLQEESTDPIYLPSGRIAFMSPRAGGLVQCGDWAWSDCMFTMNPDGTDLRQITLAKEGEWDPSLMDDGTIMFTRWEYVMRFWRPTQLIWNARPDGTNAHVIGGFLTQERNYAMCRQISGTSKVVCVEAHHHNDGSGNILVVDLKHGRDSQAGHELLVKGSGDCPYPLSEDYFLLSYDPYGRGRPDARSAQEVGIYLADTFGNMELIYQDASISAMFPMPIRPRKRPPVTPELVPEPDEEGGVFFIQNVHRGLPESMQGQARYLRIVQAHERHIRTIPCNLWSGIGGFETKTILGTVPVEKDGSASFRVPAGKGVFFSVLDERYQALHTMRMTVDIKRGERMGCVGCHEPAYAAPQGRITTLASQRPPSEIEAPPWGLQTFGFPKLVQPILNRHCIGCHDGSKEKGKAFDLRPGSEAPEAFVPDVYTIVDEGYRAFYTYNAYWALQPHIKSAHIHQYLTPPGSWGSRVSPLMQHLAQGHNKVKLSQAEWRILCAWIDCNLPYLDDWRKYSVDADVRKQAKNH